MSEIITDDWFKCYGQAWGNLCVPECMAHPAKFSRKLIFRIFEHAIEEGWIKPGETCLDLFGGVALGGLPAMMNGLHWVGIELEARFCALAQENIDLWNKRYSAQMPNWGTARIVQGDSRRLGEVLATANLCLSSPPYANSIHGSGAEAARKRIAEGRYKGLRPDVWTSPGNIAGSTYGNGYGQTEGNLGNLPDTGFEAALAVSSPVYAGAGTSAGQRKAGHGKVQLAGHHRGWQEDTDDYGTEPGQLAQMPEGSLAEVIKYGVGQYGERWPDVLAQVECLKQQDALPEGDLALACERPTCCLSSPPFQGSLSRDNVTAGRVALAREKGISVHLVSPVDMEKIGKRTQNYNAAEGQLAALPEGSHAEACERPVIAVSSPPFMDQLPGGPGIEFKERPDGKAFGAGQAMLSDYGSEQGQLAQMPPGDHAAALEAQAGAGAETGRAELCLSSPPYEGSINAGCNDNSARQRKAERYARGEFDCKRPDVFSSQSNIGARGMFDSHYGDTEGQIGKETGSTFWAASRQILEEVYKVLAPSGHCIFVCKRFVRAGKIVEFSTQWARLCEAVGFKWIHHHKAWLVEDRGAQHTLEGGLEKRVVKRFSFFRRLHAQNFPELAIEWEDVLCFVKE